MTPRGRAAVLYAVGALLGAGVVVLVGLNVGERNSGALPSRPTEPYLLNVASKPEGLCRYFSRLESALQQGEISFSANTLTLRKGLDTSISITISTSGSGAREAAVGGTIDINGRRGVYTGSRNYGSLNWNVGTTSIDMFTLSASRAELVQIARSLMFSFDESGPRLTGIALGEFRADGDLLTPPNTYATLTYDDCVRNNRPTNGRLKREISVTTSHVLTPVERLFAKSWGREATAPKYGDVDVKRFGKSVLATQAEARLNDQKLLQYTWVENNAQVTVRSTDFTEDTVIDFISQLSVASPEDYLR
jgi:hypothetical protein